MTDGRFKQLGWTSLLLVGVGVGAKVLGLARDLLIADQFGATRETDAWFLVFALWILVGIGFSIQSSKAIIPPLLEQQERGGEPASRRLLGGIFVPTALVLGALAILGWVFAPELTGVFTEKFSPENRALTVRLFRLATPVLPLTALSGILIALGRSRGRFLIVESSALLLNLGMLTALVFAARSLGVSALAIGATAGSAAMLLFLILYARSERMLPRWAPEQLPQGFQLLGYSALLVGLGHSGGLLMILVTRYFYTLLPAGQFSCHEYANRIISTPMALLMPAVLTTVLPVLAAAIARKDTSESERLGNRALRMLLAALLPPILYLVVLREPVVRAMFDRGAFTEDDVLLTALLLAALFPALVVGMIRAVTATIFYSHQSVVWPALSGVIAVLAYCVLGWLTWKPYGVVGLALSLAVADGLSLLVLLVVGRRTLDLRWPGIFPWVGKLLLVCVPAVLITEGVRRAAEGLAGEGLPFLLAQLAVAAVLSGIAFLVTARVGKLDEVQELVNVIWSRLRGHLPGLS